MYAYIIRRLLFGVVIVWGVYTITFLAVNFAPGDPFTGRESAKITEADLDRLREKWGYNLPRHERYFLHIRKMFWGDPESLEYEGGGVLYTVRGSESGNTVEARLQVPPEEIVLEPTKESRLDDGAETVVLKKQADGTYPEISIIKGRYRLGRKRFAVYESVVDVDTAGVLLHYEPGRISAKVTLPDAPETLTLEPGQGDADAVTLKRNEDGTYGPEPIGHGRFVDPDEAADLLVPEETLELGGLHFDLGRSISHNKPVVEYLGPLFWNTFKLAFWALLLNYLVGITLGVISAIRKDTPLDNGIMVSAFFVYSMPGFWLALMLQLVFAVKLGWLPIHGMGDGSFISSLKHFAMPVFVLGVAGAAGTARYQRSAVLEVLGEDYVRTARAKGLDEKTVVRKHVLRNSLLPIITLFGLSLPFLVSGAVITEQIFSWPGIGRAAIDAITGRDVFVVTAVTLAATIMVVVGNLLADVLYAFADPRVRLQ